jgi:hypothetical protein
MKNEEMPRPVILNSQFSILHSQFSGLLHCVRKDGAQRFFQDSCYRMANLARRSRHEGQRPVHGDAMTSKP